MNIKKAKDLEKGDILKGPNEEKLTINKVSKGFIFIERQAAKKRAILLDFDGGKWSQVHPEEEFNTIN